MRPVALTSFKKRCIVPATVQMFLQNSVLEVEGPLGKAELHLKTYDKKGGFSVKLVRFGGARRVPLPGSVGEGFGWRRPGTRYEGAFGGIKEG